MNQAIAIGDLATAVGTAAALDLYMGGGFNRFGSTLMEMGGASLIACQVADLIEPRAESIFHQLYEEHSDYDTKIIRGLLAAGAMAGMLVLTRGTPLASRRTLVPAAITGAGCVAGHMVTAYWIEMKAEEKKKE